MAAGAWFLYLLECSGGSYYAGITTDVDALLSGGYIEPDRTVFCWRILLAWLEELAAARGLGLNEAAREIDASRDPGTGLATAIRLAVLRHYRDRCTSPERTAASQAAARSLREG